MEALNRIFFQPEGGMYRTFRGIKAYLEPRDLSLYRKLLPEAFDMPDRAIVMVFVVDYTQVMSWMMPSYQEAGVSLQSCYKGELGWYLSTMPVTNLFAMWVGRSVGLPKYVAEKIILTEDQQGWLGQVRHRGQVPLSLQFHADAIGSFSPCDRQAPESETFFHGDVHLLASSPSHPRVRKMHFVHAIPPRTSLVVGTACVNFNGSSSLSRLVDEQLPVGAVCCHVLGGMNLVTEQPA